MQKQTKSGEKRFAKSQCCDEVFLLIVTRFVIVVG